MKFKWEIVGLAILAILLLNFSGFIIPSNAQSVVDVEGKECSVNTDCKCWGTTKGATAYGIGAGQCKNDICDMTYCIDVQPVGEYLRDHPFAWIKSHILITLGILIGGIVLARWPER